MNTNGFVSLFGLTQQITLQNGDTDLMEQVYVDQQGADVLAVPAASTADIDGLVVTLDHPLLTTSGEVSSLVFKGAPGQSFDASLDLTVSGSAETGVYNYTDTQIHYADGTVQDITPDQLQQSLDQQPYLTVYPKDVPALTGFSVAPGAGSSSGPSLVFNVETQDRTALSSISVQLDRPLSLAGLIVTDSGEPHVPPTYSPAMPTSVSTLDLAVAPALDVMSYQNQYGYQAETYLSPEGNFSFEPGSTNSLTGDVTRTVTAPLLSSDFGPYDIQSITVTNYLGGTITYSAAQLQAIGIATSFTVSEAALLGAAFQTGADGATLVAPASGQAYFEATGANDTVQLNGNVGDYTLSRVQPTAFSGASADQVGAFLLTATNGSGAYAIEEGVSAVRFQDGQVLALHDLPAYVHGDADLYAGRDGNDLLYQDPSQPYELFYGGAGHDTVYVDGNASDYTLQPFTAVTPVDPQGLGGDSYSGLELVARNGSGELLIDSSVEVVQFANGQYLSYGDLHSYVAANAAPSTAALDIALPGDFGQPLAYEGASGASTALLNGNVGDYTLSRDAAGDFVLDEHYATNGVEDTLSIGEAVATVQFRDGQYLSLKDLGAYVAGSDVFTQGGGGNDILFAPLSGDSYVVGASGTDDLYLHGNTRDYTIQAVDVAATSTHPAVDGYELVADNGSGNIYIDASTEVVHFQDGQYLAFQDLRAYVEPFHG